MPAISRTTPVKDLPEFLTVVEAARFLGIAKTTGYELVQQGRLPAVFFGNPSPPQYPNGKIIRIPRSALIRMAEQRELETASAT